jgi:cytochrome oxidase Cu insertion factor (SCO1/SenC/PrrC family)
MSRRTLLVVLALLALAACAAGVALGATHRSSHHARMFDPHTLKPTLPRAHFCHPGRKGSELDSLLN